MSWELINRITVKPDGVYLSSHSSNDTSPFCSWRCDSLSAIYAAEGQAGLDREIICMLCNYAQLRGHHKSVERYRAALESTQAQTWRAWRNARIEERWSQLTRDEQTSVHRRDSTPKVKEYLDFERETNTAMYTALAALLSPAI